jgi:anti-sigma factor RsiW
MNCRDVQPLAGNYLDGELPEEMCDRIQRHILSCSACRAEIDSLRMAVDVLRATHSPGLMGEFSLQTVLDTLQRELDITTTLPDTPGQLVLGIGIPQRDSRTRHTPDQE